METEGIGKTLVSLLDAAVKNFRVTDMNGRECVTSFEEELELQQRNVPKAYRLGEQIRQLSKKGILAVTADPPDTETIYQCYENSLAPIAELITLRLPEDLRWRHSTEAGQEFVEFVLTIQTYPIMIGGPARMPARLPEAFELYVTPQMYLAGLADTPGELSRLAGKYLLRPENRYNLERRILVRENFIEIAQTAYDYLDNHFNRFSGSIIDASRRRGFMNTFRGRLDRIRYLISAHEDALNRIFDQHARLGGD